MVTRVLDSFKHQSPEQDLHEAFLKITTKQEHKKARALVLRGNRDIKQSGSLMPHTVVELVNFAKKSESKSIPTKQIADDGVKGVLYFGR